MKTKQISPIGLSVTGAGPKIFKPVFMILVIGIISEIFFSSFTKIPFVKIDLTTAGWIWAICGAILWICAIVQFSMGFPKGKLITSGVYSLSRNPIYASWIVFILPGVAAICNNWIFLVASFTMYLSLTINIKEEEKALAETFGEQYRKYSERVSRVLSFPHFYDYPEI